MKKNIFLLFTPLSFLFGLLSDWFFDIVGLFDRQKGFNARFGRESRIASRWNKGFKISRNRKLTRKQSYEHLMVVAPTGAGKSSRILIPLICELKNCSLVINDPDRFVFNNFSQHLSRHFPTIKLLNFSASSDSSGYNLLANIKKPHDVNKLVSLLMRSVFDKSNADPFWNISASNMLQVFVRLVMHQPEGFRNCAQVLHILKCFSAHPSKVDAWIIATKDERLALDYKAIISTSEKTLQNIISTAQAALQIFEDEEIAKVTSHTSINFEELRKQPTIIFLHNSIADQAYINTLNGIFFSQLFGHVLSKLPEKNDLDLFVVIEEASSLFINQLPIALANLRKFRAGAVICCQSTNQLKTMYKEEADNIKSNTVTKLYLPGQTSLDEMRDIEALSGKTTYADKKGVEKTKSLLTIEEIRQLPKNRSLILSANHPVIKGRTTPYFRSMKYRSYALQGAVSAIGDVPNQPITYLK